MARQPRQLARVVAAADLPDAAAIDAYVGPAGELIADHIRGLLMLHNGSTPGGIRLARADQLFVGTFGYIEEVIEDDETITLADLGKCLVADKATAIAFNFDPATDLGPGFVCMVKNVGAGSLTLNPDGTEEIDGESAVVLTTGAAAIVKCDGTALRTYLSTGDLAQKASLTGVETLTNKTLTAPVVNNPTLTLKQSASPAPTAEGDMQWDTDEDAIVVGDGAGQRIFRPVTLQTPQAATSGTSKDFAVPSTAKRITIHFDGVSTTGTSPFLVQIGDAGGIETTGYTGAGTDVISAVGGTYTAGFGIGSAQTAARFYSGKCTLDLMSASNNKWSFSGMLGRDSDGQTILGSGIKALSAAITAVRVTTLSGTPTFDAGEINISYE